MALFSDSQRVTRCKCSFSYVCLGFREKYGGIKPPVLRSENDFDPGSKYHVPANIPYIRSATDYNILSSTPRITAPVLLASRPVSVMWKYFALNAGSAQVKLLGVSCGFLKRQVLD